MKLNRLLSVATVLLLAGSAAYADGTGDGRIGTKPIPPVDPPPCASFQFSADSSGAITGANAICGVTANTTQIDVIVPDSDLPIPLGSPSGTTANLQVYSSLTQDVPPPAVLVGLLAFGVNFNWTNSCASAPSAKVDIGGVASEECVLTAPQMPSGFIAQEIIAGFTAANLIDTVNSCPESIFFIAAGCALQFTTDAIGNIAGDNQNQLLGADAQVDSTSGGGNAPVPFPEPGSLALLGMGLAGLPFLRRKFAR